MAKKAAPPVETEELFTREELAEHFGVHKGTITRWENDGCPVAKKVGRGGCTLFDLGKVEEWKAEKDEAGASTFLSLETQRARLASAQAERVERENRVRAGELIEIEEMLSIGRSFVKALTTKIRTLPRRLVQVGAVPRDQEAAAQALCRELLTEISDWRGLKDLEKVVSNDPDDDADQADEVRA